MYDFSQEINAFWDDRVRLTNDFKDKLYTHRKANRDRLVSRLPDLLNDVSISESSFKPQGSMAMKTIIQTCFAEEEYDIDDGLVLDKEQLIDSNGSYYTTEYVRKKVLEALKDSRFVKQPELFSNCVRVFYSEDDEERHHVDFPIYRKFQNGDNTVKELANQDKWVESDPTQVNSWFEDEVIIRNKQQEGKGTQLRILIQLVKRFSRSRREWDLPNGMKLTMLAVECQKLFIERIDQAFKKILSEIDKRLEETKVIINLAHPDKPAITRTTNDQNVINLAEKIKEALNKLNTLDNDNCDYEKAKSIWDWIFKSDGFFDDYENKKNSRKSEGFANQTPSSPVDHRGGGRFG